MTKQSASTALRRGPGRPRAFNMDAALDAAIAVFRERGYHAASLSDLGAAMNLTAGSIYKAFADKRAIFLAAFDRYTDLRGQQLQRLLEAETTGFARVAAMLRFYADTAHGTEGELGCLVAGGAMELMTFDAEMAARVRAALERVEATLRALLRAGQADGSVAGEIDADAAARALLALLQGLRVVGKTGRSRPQMIAAVAQALRMVR